jgi:hypothetical protein
MRSFPSSRRVVLFAATALAVLAGTGYLVFELGRYQGGYSLLDQRREQEALQQIISQQAADADELRRQITVLQTSQEIDRETYALVESNLSELQLRIQSQEEELAFYQGIISPEDGYAGLRIQSINFTAAELEQHYILRLVLVQSISHDRRATGVVRLHIEGSRAGEADELSLDEILIDAESGNIPYAFRYFQGLQGVVVLPADFEPDQVNVEIRPQGAGGQPILHSFEWSTVAG